MKLWEVIRYCSEGAYIAGDSFVNEYGQELYFDGKRIVGIEKVDLNSTFKYSGIKNVAS